MTNLYESDAHAQLMLTTRVMPDMDTLRLIAPRKPAYLRPPEDAFAVREQAYACVLTLLAKRLASPRLTGRAPGLEVTDLPVDTWVIGPAEGDGMLSSQWFDQADGACRVVLHRTLRTYLGIDVPFLWDEVYGNIRRQRHVVIESPVVEPAAAHEGRRLLARCLAASASDRGVENILLVSGHRYWTSSMS